MNNINKFIKEVNSNLGDVIEIFSITERGYPSFELRLKETDYVM